MALGHKLNRNATVIKGFMETSISYVYAAGDVTGGKLLAHLSFAEGKPAAKSAYGGNTRVNYNAIPSCVYTYTEVASVGYNRSWCYKQ